MSSIFIICGYPKLGSGFILHSFIYCLLPYKASTDGAKRVGIHPDKDGRLMGPSGVLRTGTPVLVTLTGVVAPFLVLSYYDL